MLLSSLVGQSDGGGLDIIWLLIPLFFCMMTRDQRGERSTELVTVTESWYTTQDIEATFEAIEAVSAEWRKEHEDRREEPKSMTDRLRGFLGSRRDEESFVVKETIPPRLYRMNDRTGPVYFELTEVVGGGAVVKATYGSPIKRRIAKFKAGLPLAIPATPIGKHCPSCSKPVLPEFSLCPYCGEELLKE